MNNRFQSVTVLPHGYATMLGLPVIPGPIIHVTGVMPDDHYVLYGGRWIYTIDRSFANSSDVRDLEQVAFARSFPVK